jgi:hypothetical protein
VLATEAIAARREMVQQGFEREWDPLADAGAAAVGWAAGTAFTRALGPVAGTAFDFITGDTSWNPVPDQLRAAISSGFGQAMRQVDVARVRESEAHGTTGPAPVMVEFRVVAVPELPGLGDGTPAQGARVLSVSAPTYSNSVTDADRAHDRVQVSWGEQQVTYTVRLPANQTAADLVGDAELVMPYSVDPNQLTSQDPNYSGPHGPEFQPPPAIAPLEPQATSSQPVAPVSRWQIPMARPESTEGPPGSDGPRVPPTPTPSPQAEVADLAAGGTAGAGALADSVGDVLGDVIGRLERLPPVEWAMRALGGAEAEPPTSPTEEPGADEPEVKGAKAELDGAAEVKDPKSAADDHSSTDVVATKPPPPADPPSGVDDLRAEIDALTHELAAKKAAVHSDDVSDGHDKDPSAGDATGSGSAGAAPTSVPAPSYDPSTVAQDAPAPVDPPAGDDASQHGADKDQMESGAKSDGSDAAGHHDTPLPPSPHQPGGHADDGSDGTFGS